MTAIERAVEECKRAMEKPLADIAEMLRKRDSARENAAPGGDRE